MRIAFAGLVAVSHRVVPSGMRSAIVCAILCALTCQCASGPDLSVTAPFVAHPDTPIEVSYLHHERDETLSVRSGPAPTNRRPLPNQKPVRVENMQILLDNLARIGFFSAASSTPPAGKASVTVVAGGTVWRLNSTARNEAELARFYDSLNVLRTLYNQSPGVETSTQVRPLDLHRRELELRRQSQPTTGGR